LGGNAIGGTVPASLSALTKLSWLCAAPTRARSLCARLRAADARAAPPVHACAAMRTCACGDDIVPITITIIMINYYYYYY
jgi:hypothetical protein